MFLAGLVVNHWLFSLEAAGLTLVGWLIALAIYNRFLHPYRHFPGPFWASITGYWYFRSVRYGLGDNYQWQLHRKWGPMVRIAPNMIAIADPAAIETIYGPKTVFEKAPFYDTFNPRISKRPDAFCDRDEIHHASRRRITGPMYAQASILSREAQFDRVIKLFYQQMDRFANTSEVFDMSVWLRKYTFDIVGELHYGREGGFGFIRDNIDFQGWCRIMEVMPGPISAMTYVPYGLRTLYMMSQFLSKDSRQGMIGSFTVVDQARAAADKRLEEMKGPDYKEKTDLLAYMIDVVEDRGDKLNWSMTDVAQELWAVIWAGSDTTAIALTAIFYYLHKHPQKLHALRSEIDKAFTTGNLTYPIRFKDAIKLPYLHAVVMEAMRIHPSLGTGLPRLVPEGGADICGQYFPAGYEVIMTSGAVQFDHGVFGADAEHFVPERWLRPENDPVKMERSMLQFGYGPRVCIGRHLAFTEMFKLLPTILRDFEFELEIDEWTVFRGWFNQPKNVQVKVSRRRPTSAGTEKLGSLV